MGSDYDTVGSNVQGNTSLINKQEKLGIIWKEQQIAYLQQEEGKTLKELNIDTSLANPLIGVLNNWNDVKYFGSVWPFWRAGFNAKYERLFVTDEVENWWWLKWGNGLITLQSSAFP